jgi:glycosyltransferase involved in cell wall biosynthesis
MRKLIVLGTRGIPATHGGFETFAEKLSLYLVANGWRVTVYCQEDGNGPVYESDWQGVHRIHIPVQRDDSVGSVIFDWKAARHATSRPGLVLTLGYNTAIFNLLQRVKGQVNVINMDGIEWKRGKWGAVAKAWFWLNERIGCWAGNHLIADHPAIKAHLATRVREDKVTVIPYGGNELQEADVAALSTFGLTPGGFSVVIARPEPENSFLEMVSAFSRKTRNHKLVVLGRFEPEKNPYHRCVVAAAGNEVLFPGAIYESRIVAALRFYSAFYLHGHTVGGTNPSLVEAMGAGCAVIAHDNEFNRWVAGPGAVFFKDEAHCASLFDSLLANDAVQAAMKAASRSRSSERFQWSRVLGAYETLLQRWHPDLPTAGVPIPTREFGWQESILEIVED